MLREPAAHFDLRVTLNTDRIESKFIDTRFERSWIVVNFYTQGRLKVTLLQVAEFASLSTKTRYK